MKLKFEEYRKKNGQSVTFLSNHLGIDRKTYYAWIKGESEPRLSQLVKLAELWHCSIEDMYEDEALN